MENTFKNGKIEVYKRLFLYHKGKENAINCAGLSLEVRLEEKTVRKLIASLRKEGIPICSCNYGYFYPATYSEVVEVATRFSKYLATLSTTSVNMLRASVRI